MLNTQAIGQFFGEHGKEIIAVLIPILLIRLIRLAIRRRNEKKAFLKEQEQANRLLRDEALNNEILNPERRPGDVTEQKHAYKVEYSEKSHVSGDGAPRGSLSGRGAAGYSFGPGKTDRDSADGAWLKITEYSSLSKRSYMFKNNETVRVGSQYGNTTILGDDSADTILYFEIIPFNNQFYIRSSMAERVMISRRDSQRELGNKEIVLCDGDRVSVGGKVYEISFFRQ